MFSAPWTAALAEWAEQFARSGPHADAATIARRKAFLLPRLGLAGAVLLAAPPWIVLNGAPSPRESAIFALAQAPLLSVVVLFASKNLRLAQALSIFGWLALAAACGAFASDFRSAAAPPAALALVEAALTLDLALVGGTAASLLGLLALGGAGALSFCAPVVAYVAVLSGAAIRADRARNAAESELARDLRLYREAIGDLVIRFDGGGAASSVIGEAHKAYGLEARELLGRGLFQRVHVADRPAFSKFVSDALAFGASSPALLRLRVSAVQDESGRYVEPAFHFFEARTLRIEAHGRGERLSSIVCALRDVTAEKRAEQSVADARLESEAAVLGKTRILADIGRELREPLDAVIDGAQKLAGEELAAADRAERRECAEIVRRSGRRLVETVDALFDAATIESGAMRLSPETFSLRELVDQRCDAAHPDAERSGVELTREYSDRLERIVGDRRACGRIVSNLLSNAIKSSPAHGRVTVRLYPDGNSLALRVSGGGAGASSDRAPAGAGLGLFLVRGLVGMHGGAITVENAAGHGGVAVTIRLPLDCRLHANRPAGLARIETIARHGAIRPGDDIDLERETVKKIA